MITLNQTIKKMKELSKQGYDVFFEGRGDGIVLPVVEYYEIVDMNKIKKEKKENIKGK